MTANRISVAMSVFNNERHLPAAIESILAQSIADFEFLIVDDGSTDGSGAIIDDFAARDGRIRVFHQENRGLVRSLNRLIEEARAPLLARMDGDDIAFPERFERQVAFLDRHPDHGVLGTYTDQIDEDGRRWSNDLRLPLDHVSLVAAIEQRSPLYHSSVMMRRDVVRAAGGYRIAYAHCEDYDLWLRLSAQTRIANLPDRLMLYRHSPGQVSSRHLLALVVNSAVARLAHAERRAGRRDPTDGLERLPPIAALDRLFGRAGVADAVRALAAPAIVYSRPALRGKGLALIRDHVRAGGSRAGLWRTVARLVTFGEPRRALVLAATLVRQVLWPAGGPVVERAALGERLVQPS